MMRTSSILCVIVSLIFLTGCKDGQKANRGVQSENNRGEQSGSELPRIPAATPISLPDGIGPVKIGMTKEEIATLMPQRQLKEDGTEVVEQSDSPYQKVLYNYIDGKLYRIEFELDHKWGAEIFEETTKRYGVPTERYTRPDQYFQGIFHHVLIWRDSKRELRLEVDEWSKDLREGIEMRGGLTTTKLPPHIDYKGSLTDRRVQAELDEKERSTEEKRAGEAKEKYEQEKGEVIKKLY
jgi:hypothetical protein